MCENGEDTGWNAPRSSKILKMFYGVMGFILWFSLILYLGDRFFVCIFYNSVLNKVHGRQNGNEGRS